MQAERDYLITKVFPRLQAEASKRDVTIVPLDLRWGVTEDESKSGKVIQICLQEIENSHPFFIGLVGNRYGWCPDKDELEKNEILKERWGDWLIKDMEEGLSVTEIEMQYGVLRSNDRLNAYFYIKKGTDNEAIGTPTKLNRLKATIRNNGRYPVEEYDSPEDLGQQVEKAFLMLLNELYPDTPLSQLEKDRMLQQAFLHSRTNTYIADRSNYKVLDNYLDSGSQHYFVITGESGMGKSSLIANWLLTHIDDSQINIIYHFVGHGNEEGDYHYIQERLVNEISSLYQLPLEVDATSKDKLHWLYTKISGDKQLLIVLDGINQLSTDDHAKQLNWLPIPPKNVKYLFSTLPTDSTMDVFKLRQYPVLFLQPLNTEQKSMLVTNYLSLFRKSLTAEQTNRIVSNKKNNNTFILRVLLDELVVFGSHEKLDAYIDSYLNTEDANAFFQQVLGRFERDYGTQDVTNFLSLIHFSYKGVTETELLQMTKVVPLAWSQFICAFAPYMTSFNGYMNFSHQHINNAIAKRYAEYEHKYRDLLIDYFVNEHTTRANEELAHQYAETKNYDALYRLLRNYATFESLLNANKVKVVYYWTLLRNYGASKYSLSVYTDIRYLVEVNKPKKADYQLIGNFVLEYFGEKKIAIECYKKDELEKNFLGAFNNESISPRTFYFIACATNNIDNSLGMINNAVKTYQFWKTQNELKNMSVYGSDIWSCLVDSFLLQSKLLLRKMDVEQATQSIDEAVWLASQYFPNDIVVNTKVSREYASFAYSIGYIDSCLKWSELAYNISKDAPYEHLVSTSQYAMMLAKIDDNRHEKKHEQNIITLTAEIEKLSIAYWGKGNEIYAYAMLSIAQINLYLSDFEESVNYITRALETYKLLLGENNIHVVKCYSLLGDFYQRKLTIGNHTNDECVKFFVLASQNYSKALDLLDADDLETAVDIQSKMAGLYTKVIKYSNSSMEATVSDGFFDSAFDHISLFDTLYSELLHKEGYHRQEYLPILDEAKGLLSDRCKAIQEQFFKNGEQEIDNGNYTAAISEFENSLKVTIFLYGENSYMTDPTHFYLALSHFRLGNYQQALEHCKQDFTALKDLKNAGFSDGEIEFARNTICDNIIDPLLAVYYEMEGSHYKQHDYQAALEDCLMSLEASQLKYDGENNKQVAACYSNLGFYYDELGNSHSAIKHYEKSAQIYESLFGYLNQDVAQQYNYLGKAYEKVGNYAKAAEGFQKVLEIDERMLGSEHEYVIKDREHLNRVKELNSEKNYQQLYYEKARKHIRNEEFNEAIDTFKLVLAKLQNEEAPNEYDIADCYEEIARLYISISKPQNAVPPFEMALKHFKVSRLKSEAARASILGYNTFEEAMENLGLERDYFYECRCAEQLADAYTQVGRSDDAFLLIDKIKSEYGVSEESDIELIKIKGDAYLGQNLLKEAVHEFILYHEASEQKKYGPDDAFEKLKLVENVYLNAGNLQEAVNIASYMSEYYRRNDYFGENAVADTCHAANLYEETGNTSKAELTYIHLWEHLSDDDGGYDFFIVADRIAHFYERIGDKTRALHFYNKIYNVIKDEEITEEMFEGEDPELIKAILEAKKNIDRVLQY
jgi:preprotein translocase subunit SecA/nephrocystin-3